MLKVIGGTNNIYTTDRVVPKSNRKIVKTNKNIDDAMWKPQLTIPDK